MNNPMTLKVGYTPEDYGDDGQLEVMNPDLTVEEAEEVPKDTGKSVNVGQAERVLMEAQPLLLNVSSSDGNSQQSFDQKRQRGAETEYPSL